MDLFNQINDDIKAAMKARDKETLEALRNIKKVMLEAKSAKGATAELSNAEVVKIISKLAKQGSDSAAIYKSQNRNDLHDQEMVQVAVYEKYLPEKMEGDKLTAAIKEIIAETGATTMKDMGKVMGVASKKLAGKADGKDISDEVKKLLQ